jgi:hypothetical protein
MEKAAPWPVFRALAESLLHWVAMNVMELLYKLRMIANVEIIIALLPEVIGFSDQTPRHALLQRLQSIGERALLRFAESVRVPTQAKIRLEWATVGVRLADEKMNVLGHDNIAIDAKAECDAHAFESVFKDSAAGIGREQTAAMVTTKRYEMALPGVVITLQAPRHETSVAFPTAPLKPKPGLNGPRRFKVGLD